MVRVRTVLVAVCVSLAAPAVAAGQTVGDLVKAAEQAAISAKLSSTNVVASAALDGALQTLRDARVLDEDLDEFVELFISPDVIARAHRRQSRYRPEIKDAIDTINGIANSVLAPSGTIPRDFAGLVNQLQQAQSRAGLTFDLETLRLLERKYGPDSAKLNGLEVIAAYGLQRFPAFGISKTGRPGPLEPVIAYAPSYLTRSAEKMRVVGVFEIGLRQYLFAKGWGEGKGKLAFLRPGYLSYGLAWAGGNDDPLTPPWRGESRFGAFFGWGALKVAFVGGADKRFLVTQQFQIIPWVF